MTCRSLLLATTLCVAIGSIGEASAHPGGGFGGGVHAFAPTMLSHSPAPSSGPLHKGGNGVTGGPVTSPVPGATPKFPPPAYAGPFTAHPAGGLSSTPNRDRVGSASGMAVPGANSPRNGSSLKPVKRPTPAPTHVSIPGVNTPNGTHGPLSSPVQKAPLPAPVQNGGSTGQNPSGPIICKAGQCATPAPSPIWVTPTQTTPPTPRPGGGISVALGDVAVAGSADTSHAVCYLVLRKIITPDGEVIRKVKVCEIVDPDQQ